MHHLSSHAPAKPRHGPVIVAGGGAVGLLAALGLVHAGVETILVAPAPPPSGTGTQARTAALFPPSIALLQQLNVWDRCKDACEPLLAIRLIDHMGSLLRAPEVVFAASEAGAFSFGYNVPNAALAAALTQALAAQPRHLTWVEGHVRAISPRDRDIGVILSDGRVFSGALLVGADGRQSVCRAGAGITTREKGYNQVAVTAAFTHQRPHNGISTEFHRPAGPCTTVPLPGRASSLVWVERPDEAGRLLALDDAAFTTALEAQLDGVLGSVHAVTPRAKFPLGWLQADRYGARRVMLVGEAAHVMPPIGAQGLNLGIRDVGFLIDCIVDASADGRDPGGADTLAAYQSARASDIALRMTAVDALNRSLLSELMPVRLGRGLGLHLILAFAPLRRRLILAGLQPPGALPRLMQPLTPVPLSGRAIG